jgi:hypothetical protein
MLERGTGKCLNFSNSHHNGMLQQASFHKEIMSMATALYSAAKQSLSRRNHEALLAGYGVPESTGPKTKTKVSLFVIKKFTHVCMEILSCIYLRVNLMQFRTSKTELQPSAEQF